jgi:MFS family permease
VELSSAPADAPAKSAGWPAAVVLCVGVWLHAADSLLAATVMPTAVHEIGGLEYIYWTVALYELGSIVIGAATGLLAMRFGLRLGMTLSALLYGAGCVMSALAPDMGVMLAGRLLQGLGGGGMVALTHVGVTQLFPSRSWPRLLAFISVVWGVSALVGPLIGGLFATAGIWRGAFWAFALQALLVAAFVPLILKHAPRPKPAGESIAEALPWRRLLVLSGGVLAILVAGVQREAWLAGLGLVVGGALLWATLRLESQAAVRLFPRRPLNPRSPWGPGYLMILFLCFATVSFGTYGAFFMQTLYGTSPLIAGFVLALESVAWTITAVLFAGAGPKTEPWLIGGGAAAIAIGLAGLTVVMPHGPVEALLPWAFLQGAGFGACWSFLIRRLVESVPTADRERATSSVPTLQRLGYALGAAVAGIAVNMSGLTANAPRGVVATASFWVFAVFLPAAAAGVWAAWRVGARAPASVSAPP